MVIGTPQVAELSPDRLRALGFTELTHNALELLEECATGVLLRRIGRTITLYFSENDLDHATNWISSSDEYSGLMMLSEVVPFYPQIVADEIGSLISLLRQAAALS
jgi:hypothetical protein